MKQLQIPTPSRHEAAKIIIRAGLERVAENHTDPVKESEFLYHLHHEMTTEFPDMQYVGDALGLQYIFCWLREIWDCRDGSMILYHTDLPRKEAEKKFIEHLREAAAEWLQNNTHQADAGNRGSAGA